MIQKIKRFLGIGKPNPKEGNTVIVNVERLERRVALLDSGVLEEYTVEREGEQNIVGGIFKGRVKNIEPGLKAMFVDIGLDKNAFLHFWDAIPAALDAGLEEIERASSHKKKQQQKITSKDIPSIYPVGSEIMIQVSKGPIGTKGPRVTTNISLAGRESRLSSTERHCSISIARSRTKWRARVPWATVRMMMPMPSGTLSFCMILRRRRRSFGSSILREIPNCSVKGISTR